MRSSPAAWSGSGVGVTLRLVDSVSYEERMKSHDFEITTLRFVFNLSPGAELNANFATATADQVGSSNAAGIKDPVVDALIAEVVGATDRATSRGRRPCARPGAALGPLHDPPSGIRARTTSSIGTSSAGPLSSPATPGGVIDTWWVDREKDDDLRAYREGAS